MSMTYSGDPSTSSRDAVRYLIGDTDTTDYFLGDDEVDWVLDQESNIYEAAITCCLSIMAKLSKEIPRTVGALSLDLGQRYNHYEGLLARLTVQRDRKRGRTALPVSTGTSSEERSAAFTIGQFDHPSTAQNTGDFPDSWNG